MSIIEMFQDCLPIWLGFVFWFGLLMGSFSGVVAYRLPYMMGWREGRVENLLARSRCESCGEVLGFVDLIPIIGWLVNGGRCRYCHASVSISYPIMEFLAGIFSMLIAWRFGVTLECVVVLLLFQGLFILSWIDWQDGYLPFVVTIPLLILGVALSPVQPDIPNRILGMATFLLVVWGTMWGYGKIRGIDASMGGDIVFAAMAGSWLGWKFVLVWFFLQCVFFILYGTLVRALKIERDFLEDGLPWIPMGPALSMSLMTCILLNGEIKQGISWLMT